MSKGYCEKSELTAIADAIRTKTKKTDTMSLAQMPTEIENIKGGDEYTENTLVVKNYTSSQIKELPYQIDISSLDTQNVTNMIFMFQGCSKQKSLDLSNFNTQNVTNMYSMFKECYSLTSLDLSSFDTQKVTDMRQMFYYCNKLISIKVKGGQGGERL